MEPGTRISQPKPEWMILKLSIPSGHSEECIIKATLDGNITETHRTDLQLWNTFDIDLYSKYRESPLSIGEVCV